MGTDILGQPYTKLEKTDHSFLERFLDTTKANLFFAKGVILVEGWAEEIMLPSLAKKIGVDLTKKGISIVNVGSTALLRYSKIFQRKTGAKMDLPVAVITDLDIKPNKHKEADPETKTESDFNLMEEINSKKTKYEGDTVKAYISPHWTLEYCIALSPKLAPHLYTALKNAIKELRDDGTSISEIALTYDEFAKDKSPEEIAYVIYQDYICKKKISKAVLAQQFAQVIDKDVSQDAIKDSPEINYLCGGNTICCRVS